MKRKSIISLSIIFVFVLIFSLCLPLFAQDTVWTKITTNRFRVKIKNMSENILIVRWDSYAPEDKKEKVDSKEEMTEEEKDENFEIIDDDSSDEKGDKEYVVVKEGINKTYLQTYILPGETFIMPPSETVYIKVPMKRVSMEKVGKSGLDFSTVVVTD